MEKRLLQNKRFLEIVSIIEEKQFAQNGKWEWDHTMSHFQRVADYIEDILRQFHVDERMVTLGRVAGLLHDVGLSVADTNHASIGSTLFVECIDDLDLQDEEIEILRSAIINHSNGECIDSLVSLALLLADKMDVTYHRTVYASKLDPMLTELQKIQKVEVQFTNEELILYYYATSSLDFDALQAWDKIYTIPEKVAQYLGKEFVLHVVDADEIYLVNPSIEDKEAVMNYRSFMLENGNTIIHGSNFLQDYEVYEDWLQNDIAMRSDTTCPEGLVSATTFLIYAQDTFVGMINCRHHLNDYLATYGGHIGYGIHPNHRKKGYAKKALQQVLDMYKHDLHLDEVLLICDKKNSASQKVITSFPHRFDGEVIDVNQRTLLRYFVYTTK
ncbi:hypothetical protein A4S06_04935 [Erysipelotrichaceae bacterium MTC7]|nr:hypothetical protein A4S06_04935 [Erysipelotrichaceae bacterium MTC7]